MEYNKQVQTEYYKLFKERSWDKYKIEPMTKGVGSITGNILVDKPDFRHLAS